MHRVKGKHRGKIELKIKGNKLKTEVKKSVKYSIIIYPEILFLWFFFFFFNKGFGIKTDIKLSKLIYAIINLNYPSQTIIRLDI